MEERTPPGFMVYLETWLDFCEDFTQMEIGQLLTAALQYASNGDITVFDDRSMKTAFRRIIRDIDIDHKRYETKILKSRYANYCKAYKEDDPRKPTYEQWLEQYNEN